MKCPKCGYLGFQHVERCRNCGYDFSLTVSTEDPELPIKPAGAIDHESPLPDISLAEAEAASTELPLFEGEEPLITRPSPPRAPLAVRRSTPEVPRLRSQSRVGSLDFGSEPRPANAAHQVGQSWSPHTSAAAALEDELPAAGVGARLGAVVLDLLILAAVDVAVVYLTLQICGVSLAEAALVPKAPLAVFLLVQNLGYLAAFNAGGQTLGKMALGIRVVPADELSDLDVGHAILRTLVWAALAVPAGLGFLSALPDRDHRGLHDRFAGTRVVRA